MKFTAMKIEEQIKSLFQWETPVAGSGLRR